MSLLLAALWPGLAATLLLGMLVGALTGLPRERVSAAVAVGLAVMLAILAGLSLTGQVPGEAGLWVEAATLLLAGYLAGCLLGGTGRLLVRPA